MKKLIFLFFISLVTTNFSQTNSNLLVISQLKDVNGISLNDELFNGKYTLICNIYEESAIAKTVPYFKEVQKIYRNAFFNSIENRGITVLILIHFSMINHHQHLVLKNMLLIPVNSANNDKIIQNSPLLTDSKNLLINSLGEIVNVDFLPQNIRLDLTKYLKRE
jgi:hypothetical protein